MLVGGQRIREARSECGGSRKWHDGKGRGEGIAVSRTDAHERERGHGLATNGRCSQEPGWTRDCMAGEWPGGWFRCHVES